MALFDFFSAKSLEDAVQRNSIRSARRLLEKGVPQAKLNECVILAVHSGVEMIELLLEYGADLNHQHSEGGKTPLHIAARFGYVDVARFLLQHGARIDIADSNGETPLAATLQSPHEAMSLALGLRPTHHDENESARRKQIARLIKECE